ncbi:right-handed parallel beta-helix repeat-containing protein [Candidatus Eisenbacteria bacterium]|uniref:Right-handed parallel beta-helix repeat-containing protein n=1 Tax=Eiseniibacteriota bacterium TaxID=2212470 RepID=A0ABV6YM96_UNCEI
MKVVILLVALAVIPATALSTTYVVNPEGTGDYPTIQAAIDACGDGCIIALADGTFTGPGNRDIDYLGKAIAVRSQSGEPELCIIDCEQAGRGFYFHSGEGPESVLETVTITNGSTFTGGGISCFGSPSIRSCVFTDNLASGSGGAIFTEGSPIIDNCVFDGNLSQHGGAIHCQHASPIITGCTFTANAGDGGAVHCYGTSSPVFANCTFFGNEATENGSSITCRASSAPVFQNTIIANGVAGPAIHCTAEASPALACCNIFGNAGGDWVGCIADQYGVDGNISNDPLFCDLLGGDFLLHWDSPCAPTYNPACGLIGAWPVGCGIPTPYACCIGAECQLLSLDACIVAGGNALVGVLVCDPNPCGDTFVVNPDSSGHYPTIQAAVNAAANGDTILLANGVFTGGGNKHVELWGKVLTVRSQSGLRDSCIIDCEGSDAAFYVHHFEDLQTTIEGITICNAGWDGISLGNSSPTISDCAFVNNAPGASGVQCNLSSPRIAGCMFAGNLASQGAGIKCDHASPTVDSCQFIDNMADYGGGIYCTAQSYPVIAHCLFSRNYAVFEGGGIHATGGAAPTISNCTFAENTADLGGGMWFGGGSSHPMVENCIVAFMIDGGGIKCQVSSIPVISCTDIFGNVGGDWVGPIADQLDTNGNFSADPHFCDADNNDFHLWNYSPCNREGTCGLIGAWPVGCWDPQDLDGPSVETGRVVRLTLAPAMPNPFRSSTQIAYSIPAGNASSPVSLKVYDTAGRVVRVLRNASHAPGTYRLAWDGQDQSGRSVATGTYFAKLAVNGEQQARRILVIR